jgi:hypothetical protein
MARQTNPKLLADFFNKIGQTETFARANRKAALRRPLLSSVAALFGSFTDAQ